jgi:hypothetical protein
MEPFENRRQRRRHGGGISPRLFVGLGFLAAGVLLALDRFTQVDIGPLWRFWPLVLVAFGLSRILQPGEGRGGGLIPLGIGIWLLGNNFGWWYLRFNDIVPFLVILVGLLILGRMFKGSSCTGSQRGMDEARVDAFAMMGLSRRVTNSQAFKGGGATAIMGACEIDLRQAALGEGGAVIDCFAMWGGIQIAVPEGWSVSLEGMPIMGSFEDRTVQSSFGSPNRLVIRGAAIMGSVQVGHRLEND